MATLRKSDIRLYIYAAPLVFLALPLGLPNAVSQSIALLTVLPALGMGGLTLRSTTITLLAIIAITANSLYQSEIHAHSETSWYQAARSAIPFFIIILALSSYRSRLNWIHNALKKNPIRGTKLVDALVSFYATSCALQVALFFAGIDAANALSSSKGHRVMIFQSTSCLLLVYYTIARKLYWPTACLFFVTLGSGSKSLFAGMILVIAISFLSKLRIKHLLRGLGMLLLMTTLIVYVNPTAPTRIIEFIVGTDDNGALEDKTRSFEIEHAKSTLLSEPETTLLGAGFLIQLTPGVPTTDPAWAENSKYDIENGYWGLAAKLGIFFVSAFLLICTISLPRNRIILCVLAIESVMFFKTSYQVFAYFDGVFLLFWALILNAVLYPKTAHHPTLDLTQTPNDHIAHA